MCVCTVMDFFTSGVEFCSAVYQRPMQGITHKVQNWTIRPARVFSGQRVVVVSVVDDRPVWI